MRDAIVLERAFIFAAFEQITLVLQRLVACGTLGVLRFDRGTQPVDGEVGRADDADLARLDRRVERLGDRAQILRRIVAMRQIAIDIIGAEPRQRGVDRRGDVLGREALAVAYRQTATLVALSAV